jgi:hypothetical protein
MKLSNRPVFLKDFAHQVSVIAAFRDQEKNLYKQTSQVGLLLFFYRC